VCRFALNSNDSGWGVLMGSLNSVKFLDQVRQYPLPQKYTSLESDLAKIQHALTVLFYVIRGNI